MKEIVKFITKSNQVVNDFVWGPPMLVVFLLVGLYFTVRTRFFQFTNIKLWMNTTILACFKNKEVRKTEDKKSISQFQSLCTALAGTIGTGNIAGVATAIVLGGPGAIFWMWLSALLGMMTHYAESVLAIKYRYKNEKGSWIGGPMIYIERGLKLKWLAVIFSIFCVLASFGIGNMAQSNSISSALYNSFGIPTIVTGVVIAVLIGLVIMGGIKRIASVTEKFVPLMAGIYLLGAFIIIGVNIEKVPGVFGLIFKEAFRLQAATGGIVGYGIMSAMKRGISRGVFSNEAGLGSSVMVHSSSDVKEPVIQGMWGIFEVFADTIIVCTITALTILCSGAYEKQDYMEYNTQVVIRQEFIEEANKSINNIIITNEEDMVKEALLIADEMINSIYSTAQDVGGVSVVEDGLYGGEELLEGIKLETINVLKKYRFTNQGKLEEAFDSLLHAKREEISFLPEKKSGVPLTSQAFESVLGKGGNVFVSIAVMLFAFSTLLGWSYYGERGIEFLFGLKAVPVYKAVFLLVIILGAVLKIELVWDLSDTFNGLMAMPNLLALGLLSRQVLNITKEYRKRRKESTPAE